VVEEAARILNDRLTSEVPKELARHVEAAFAVGDEKGSLLDDDRQLRMHNDLKVGGDQL
jgi:hypothetical protein